MTNSLPSPSPSPPLPPQQTHDSVHAPSRPQDQQIQGDLSRLSLDYQQHQHQQQQQQPLPLPRISFDQPSPPQTSMEQPPPYSFSLPVGNYVPIPISGTPNSAYSFPIEEHLFQIQELMAPPQPVATSKSTTSIRSSIYNYAYGSSSVGANTGGGVVVVGGGVGGVGIGIGIGPGSGPGPGPGVGAGESAQPTPTSTPPPQPHNYQFICANPMHDQQYLLVGSTSALHSIDLTLPAEKQSIRTHIQGLAFKEIHCLEDIGLIVVIAGRNARVRCYDYDSIKKLVSYGHSKEGHNRIVEGGRLGAMKNMIQLRVETAFQKDENHHNPHGDNNSPNTSPKSHMTATNASGTNGRILKGSSAASPVSSSTSSTALSYPPQLPPSSHHHHQHTRSIDRSSLLSPPARMNNNSGGAFDEKGLDHDAFSYKKNKQRPLSFGGLASLAHEHVMKKSQQQQHQQQAASTPVSPSTGAGSGFGVTKNKRFSQMASYLSQAAVNSNMAAHVTSGQDAPSEEAISWAWDFTKLKQTKDVLSIDFHYTYSTVYMTILSKNGIDIYCRPKFARGLKAASWSAVSSSSNAETSGRPRSSSLINGSVGGTGGAGGMVTAASYNSNNYGYAGSRDDQSNNNPYEWRHYKEFYHPEAPSFMTVVKSPQDVTDIVLGKGPRAWIVNVDTMSVTDIHKPETSSGGILHGIGKRLGFRSSSNTNGGNSCSGGSGSGSSGGSGGNALWYSFEKIPFDVPPHILYPEATTGLYGGNRNNGSHSNRDSKEQYSTFAPEQSPSSVSTSAAKPILSMDAGRRSHDDIIQRPCDQLSIHQQQLEEQERAEADALALKALQLLQLQASAPEPSFGSSSTSPCSSSSSSASINWAQQQQQQQAPSSNNNNASINPTAAITTTNHPLFKSPKKTRMVTSDEVLNMAFNQRTMNQLFLATCGSQSRIVDIHGKPQSSVILDWESFPPQKIDFLKTPQDIYVVGFEKTSIVIFSLSKGSKVKEITKKDLVTAADAMAAAAAAATATASNTHVANSTTTNHNIDKTTGGGEGGSGIPAIPSVPAATSIQNSQNNNNSSTSHGGGSNSSPSIKFLGRDNVADDSLGIFFSYCHPRNGISICKLGLVPLVRDDLELIGYY
ncbi:hypothetical protein BCR41DRAFT_350965 [Lobosporangium transversale]|uniref:CNH domain-containing protein n=1 Tax=Lobosporangium transversale TaxID=64571 RepID=A0A1Y2GWI3_9FUNG|nr:hypothetical protein BCR41DRAFT_350965 [Lobosporangium transversale]ORZ21053.1 hypothetical protein BCR41DRAFT_350965 [Lobosporangium transversale]|eukprot:XP_021882962.1 hypothetical protein BCR41DRAFT_350965 [Lobosporangium transversale]